MAKNPTATQRPEPATDDRRVSRPETRAAEPEQRNQDLSQLHTEVERRFGVLPNFFRLAPESPEITANLWGFARFAYLDNPLPSLFKERLFVYLSRFCDVRYCIARHVGFLVGLGRPSGDAQSPVQTIEDIIRLIQRPFPRAEHVELYLSQCAACDSPLSELPAPDSVMEQALFACATHAFLQTPDAPRCVVALQRVLGEVHLQHLMVFLAFIRTAHYWTKIHNELTIEEDLKQLLATHQTLAEYLLNDPEAGTCEISQNLMHELTLLREAEERHHELSQAHQALRESEERLQRTNTELAQRVAELQRANVEIQESRRAALNVMEDAVQSRQAVETLNVELCASEERFRSLVSVITDVPWTADAEGAFVAPQPAWAAFTGQSWEELRSFGWAKALHADDRAKIQAIWERACESRTLYESSGRLWHAPSGEYRYFIARATPLLNQDGTVRAWVGTCTDIDRREAGGGRTREASERATTGTPALGKTSKNNYKTKFRISKHSTTWSSAAS